MVAPVANWIEGRMTISKVIACFLLSLLVKSCIGPEPPNPAALAKPIVFTVATYGAIQS
jgi:hypothetical protein